MPIATCSRFPRRALLEGGTRKGSKQKLTDGCACDEPLASKMEAEQAERWRLKAIDFDPMACPVRGSKRVRSPWVAKPIDKSEVSPDSEDSVRKQFGEVWKTKGGSSAGAWRLAFLGSLSRSTS